MKTPSFQEDHISQIPAIQFLCNLGYQYLTPQQALDLRGGKTTGILLEQVVKKKLKDINSISYKDQSHSFTDSNILSGIHALKDSPLQEGLITANEYIYDLITLGKSLEQTIEGDKKSYNLQYIDWKNWKNNVFHVTEEFSVMRSTSKEHYRPDLILFVNGIPLVVIECKRPDQKDNIEKAMSQHLRNQQEDGIRSLFVYSQLLLSLATNVASYATTATQPKFWSKWTEKFEVDSELEKYNLNLKEIKNKKLSEEQSAILFSDRFKYVKSYFDSLEKEERKVTEQDRYLHDLCRPERLLSLIFSFIIYDAGTKKIARYQQYFAIIKALNRIVHIKGGKRKGGVIWHTQGSGKSLTMVMLAQTIALQKSIKNPKIVIVTDRVDLDDQIYGTFDKCDLPVIQANTGTHLVDLLSNKSDAVITTIINKFEAAVKRRREPFSSHDIFVLIDEGHRTQYGTFNVSMEKTFPNACFIAFTGTPLRKKEKNTASKFGGLIDTYTVDQAVKDKAVVPLLYEGRHAVQNVNEDPINTYFDMVSEPLNEYQRSDMKKKFSRSDQLNIAEQKINIICWDLNKHFIDNWRGTGFKGQLVCQNKLAAIKYKEFLDEIPNGVTSELIMSSPDMREGEDTAYAKTPEKIKRFWEEMMQEHGSKKKYEKNIITRYKYQNDPEIIIVVDKLLTGFDAPNNTILYLTRSLKEHTLLQAIARVNRVAPGKDYGYIIDYYGVLKELDEALKTYSSFQEFQAEDLEFTMTNVREEIKQLPQVHSELWDYFKEVKNKYDEPAYEEILSDEAIRVLFYDKVSLFARILKLALSSLEWHKETQDKEIERYKYDLGFFTKLRSSVRNIYSDTIDFKAYEKQIQKLIDKHVTSHEVKPITDLVNIFETERFEEEVEKVIGTAAKADMIASRTDRHINEKMDEDPTFYKRFSELLKETIRAYREKRISEAEYLKRVSEIKDNVLNHTGSDIPEILKSNQIAQAFYGITIEQFKSKINDQQTNNSVSANVAIGIDAIIQSKVLDAGVAKVDWQSKSDLIGQLEIAIGDFIMDEIRDKYELSISFGEINEMTERYIDIAKIRYR